MIEKADEYYYYYYIRKGMMKLFYDEFYTNKLLL